MHFFRSQLIWSERQETAGDSRRQRIKKCGSWLETAAYFTLLKPFLINPIRSAAILFFDLAITRM